MNTGWTVKVVCETDERVSFRKGGVSHMEKPSIFHDLAVLPLIAWATRR